MAPVPFLEGSGSRTPLPGPRRTQPRSLPLWARLAGLFLLAPLRCLSAPALAAGDESGSLRAPDAVVLNVTEPDLNRMVQGTLHSLGGPVFEGVSHNPSRGLYDLRYHVSITDPVLKLGADGEARVTFSIREAHVQIGRYERKIGKKIASCENLGLTVDPDQPVDVTVGFHLAIEGGDVKILPDQVSIPDAEKRFHLVKPTHCANTPLPRWLLWWIGKPRLKRRLGTIDHVLLASFQKSAGKLNQDGGLFGKRWDLGAGSEHGRGSGEDGKSDLLLYPGLIDTGRGALFMSLTASNSFREETRPRAPEWASSLSNRSFLAVSEPLLNALTRRAFSRLSSLPRKPGGSFAKLLKSDSLLALIPGLRQVDHKEKLYFTFKMRETPRVELRGIGEAPPVPRSPRLDAGVLVEASPAIDASAVVVAPPTATAPAPGADGSSAMIGGAAATDGQAVASIAIHVEGMEVSVWRAGETEDALLGSLEIESGHVGLAPYASPLGGVSFEVLENDWKVSSSGIEFNDELFAATIQELIFGEAFETRYEPLLRDGLGVGDTRLMPGPIRVVEDYLVIEFAGM